MPGHPTAPHGGSWSSCWDTHCCCHLLCLPLVHQAQHPWVVEHGLLHITTLKSPWVPLLVEGTLGTNWTKEQGPCRRVWVCSGGLGMMLHLQGGGVR